MMIAGEILQTGMAKIRRHASTRVPSSGAAEAVGTPHTSPVSGDGNDAAVPTGCMQSPEQTTAACPESPPWVGGSKSLPETSGAFGFRILFADRRRFFVPTLCRFRAFNMLFFFL